MTTLVDLLDIEPIHPSDWPKLTCWLDNSRVQEAAGALADAIASRRIGSNDRLYELWRAHRVGISYGVIGDTDTQLLEAGLLQDFGRPAQPATDAHLHGLIAEAIWHAVVSHIDFGPGRAVRIEGNDWSVTDHGGDGLTVYITADGGYCFRLWESKYHGSDTPVQVTVKRACDQVKSNALSYLSRFSLVAQHLSADPELASFYGRLAELWADSDPAAGVGISVGASEDVNTEEWFGNVVENFGLEPSQHQAHLHLVGDFIMLAETVRNEIWKGCGLWTEP